MRFIRTIAIGALLLGLAYKLVQPRGGPSIGLVAPSISAPLLNGGTFDLAAHSGHVVVLDFWATWCPPCRRSLPALQRLHERYKDSKDVVVISVSQDKGAQASDRVRKYLSDRGFTFPVIIDPSGIASRYGVSTIPTMVVIDPEGTVRTVQVGLYSSDTDTIVDHVVQAVGIARQPRS